MAQENVEIMQRIFDAWAIGDFSAGADTFDEHVVFIVSRDFPAFGVHFGREDVRKYLRDFVQQWERVTIKAKRLEAVGDTVLAHVVQHNTGKASGIEGDLEHFMLFSFRGKKIIRWESVMSEADARKAVGLSRNEAHADSS